MDRPVSLIFHLQNNKKKKLPEVKSEIMCLQKKKRDESPQRPVPSLVPYSSL